jgi:aspartate racemase
MLMNSTITVPDTGDKARPLWGILGGMGPLSSAEFVKTIYELRAGESEQQGPPLILWSDPRIPDRTECLLHGRQDLLLERLTESLQGLVACDVTNIVICCITIHHIIDLLPLALRARITSLVDVIYREVLKRNERYVLLCTNGTRKVRLFEKHRLWKSARSQIVLPSWEDQQRVHNLIYQVKHCRQQQGDIGFIKELVTKYGADSFIAGCTELHVLIREYRTSSDWDQNRSCLDPLMVLGEAISRPSVRGVSYA